MRLPGALLCYAPPADAPEPATPSRTAGVTFGCFAELSCVTPDCLTMWSRLLGALPHSRLVLGCGALGEQRVGQRITEHLASQGVAGNRIRLLGAAASALERLERYRDIDVALDTLPWSGTRVTCEALWMGVPVVTLSGASRQTRFGSTLLAAAGLPELVARDPEGYIGVATRLAADDGQRRQLRGALRPRLRASDLLDARGFARNMEAACRGMLQAAGAQQAARVQGVA